MKYARSSAAAAVWNNKIIICGGFIGLFNVTDTAECYNPEDNSWNEFTHLPTPLWGHSFVTYENNFILFGGWVGKEATNAVWQLDPQESNSTWKPLEPMKYPSAYFAGKIFDQEIYAIGGYQKKDLDLSRVEIFDGERWRDGAALPYNWYHMSSVIIPPTLADRLSQYKKE